MKKYILVLLTIFTLTGSIWSLPKVYDLLTIIDKNDELGSDITAKAIFTQQKVNEGTKKYEYIYYRRDSDDSFLIIAIAPDVEKGNGYLKVGDNFWMYKRNTRTFQHVNRDENISGTDARSGDMEMKKMVDLYEPVLDDNGNEMLKETKLGKQEVYYLKIKGKPNEDVKYPVSELWMSKKEPNVILMAKNYSLSGTLMQTAAYLSYVKILNSYIPLKQIFIDEFEKGNKTMMEISGISTQELGDSIFTKAYLENLSK